jgi:alpha/beta superfamily hydrolase
MTKGYHRTFFLKGPAGRLEAMLWSSARTEPALAAVVCHPHPLYGGTMHNKVVFRVAKTLHRLGLPVLRFNFRGAGLSEGTHDEGRGETGDVRAAIGYMSREFHWCSIVLVGFSFGAWVGLRVGCVESRVGELVGVGIPVDISDLSYLVDCEKPKLFIQGSRDQYGARETAEALVSTLPEPKRAVFVEGADHFFAGKLHHVEAALRDWMVERHPELGVSGTP